MAQEFKRSYKFALYTSLLITVFAAVLMVAFQLYYQLFSISASLIFAAGFFVVSFLIIQFRVEIFIYRRVKEVYDKVSLLDASSLQEEPVATDMKMLTREIEKFSRDKKLEIEALKIRENYRKEFMGNISHELKTPLFTVQSYILTLLDGAGEDKKIRQKYLTRASKGVDRLIYIVKDLDMITRLEAGDLNLHKEKFDMVGLIESVFELFEMKAAKKDITLTFDMDYKPIYVYADKEKIQQVLTNLVVNAIKYGKKGGTTEISLEPVTDKKLLIRVTDNGEGIEPHYIPRLFERFFRIDKSGSRKEGGSGLGLSIVKHILEAHQEKIYVESDFGIGSEFSFTLPVYKAELADIREA